MRGRGAGIGAADDTGPKSELALEKGAVLLYPRLRDVSATKTSSLPEGVSDVYIPIVFHQRPVYMPALRPSSW